MTQDDKNNHDDLIDLSGSGSDENPDYNQDIAPSNIDGIPTHEDHDPFSPPPPKGSIFQTDDTDSIPGPDDRWKGTGNSPGQTRLEDKYSFEMPGKKESYSSIWKIANHPVVKIITLIVLLIGVFGSTRYSPMWWCAVVASVYLGPYWIVHRPRWQRYYNQEWDARAEPTGCFYPSGRSWWW